MTGKDKFFDCCEHPVLLKKDGREMLVECGVCPHCLLKKSRRATMLCNNERLDTRYCWFVTLTYSQDFVPRMRPVLVADGRYQLVGSSPDRPEYGKILSHFSCKPEYIGKIQEKTCMNGDLSYACLSDIQKFMKRVRYFISLICNEKIKYYIVSEYGPKTFRVHWHLLIFFDSELIYDRINDIIRKSWRFGRINVQPSKSLGTSSYVARYVNQFTHLPRFYNFPLIRPRQLHSRYFGQKFFTERKTEIYENVGQGIISLDRMLGGSDGELFLWRTLENSLFPKTYDFRGKLYSDISRLYHAYDYAEKLWPVLEKPSDFVSIVMYRVRTTSSVEHIERQGFRKYRYPTLPDKDSFVHFVIDQLDIRPIDCWENSANYTRAYSRLYHLFNVSRRFKYDLCDGDMRKADYVCSTIIRYYDLKDYCQLKSFYLSQERYTRDVVLRSSPTFVKGYLSYYVPDESAYWRILEDLDCVDAELYDIDFIDSLYSNVVFQQNQVQNRIDLHNSVKHKKINDSNSEFLRY